MFKHEILFGMLSLWFATEVWAETAINCELTAQVIPSTQFAEPTAQYTTMKNDGYPMLLLGINITSAEAVGASKRLAGHQRYCRLLNGSTQDVYLFGRPEQYQLHVNDVIRLKLMHTSGNDYPYWPNHYVLIQ